MSFAILKSYFSINASFRFYHRSRLSSAQQHVIAGREVIKENLRLRPLLSADIPQLMDIRRKLGGIEVESCFRSKLKLDPEGIQVAVTHTGEIVGTCSGTKLGDGEDGFCFGGLFYVKPEYRRQRIGSELWKFCRHHIGHRNAAFNALPELMQGYREFRSIFNIDDSFTLLEYRSLSPDFASSLASTPPPGTAVVPFHSSHLPALFAYDSKLMGFDRTFALKLHLQEEGSKTLVAFRSDDSCAGFGTIKLTCMGMVLVGPLYADTPEVAEVLLRKLVEMHAEGAGFVYVTTSANQHAKRWMEGTGVTPFTMRKMMYNKERLDVELGKVFTVSDVNFAPF